MDEFEGYLAAVTSFADLVERLGEAPWEGPGLGVWTLRDLLGHTVSSGLGEVADAFDRPVASSPVIGSPEAYYALAHQVDPHVYAAAVAASTADARRAGDALGSRPEVAVRDRTVVVRERLAAAAPTDVVTTAAGAMVLQDWLPTRTFELVVHGLDIAACAEVEYDPPAPVLHQAVILAAGLAAVVGEGPTVLRALTGRGRLPAEFSVMEPDRPGR